MMALAARIASLLICLACWGGPAAAQAPAVPPSSAPAEQRAVKLDGRPLPLGGALANARAWQAYKQRFVTASGRVVDSANGFISHSEGQGYGMLLAVAANDRQTFERIWGWTRANLMVRDDQLIAWRWTPGQRPAVADMNNATDGDILVAWALAEASDFWGDAAFRAAGRRIAVEVGRKLILFKTPLGALMLPGVMGFSAADRADGPVVNLSYYVFPAFARLGLVAPEVDWAGLTQTGLDLIKAARFGPAELPSDWISAREGALRPAQDFPPQFSYNAIRIPLYLAWAGVGDWQHYRPLRTWAEGKAAALSTVDVTSGREVERLTDRGYASIAALLACALDRAPPAGDFWSPRDGEHYYPSTLHLMALTAVNMRHKSCVKG